MSLEERLGKAPDLHEVVSAADQVLCLWGHGGEKAMTPLTSALAEFAGLVGDQVNWSLAGGLAVGLRARPRGTQDVDILLSCERDVLAVTQLVRPSFRQVRSHALEHRETGVEVELLTAEFLGFDQEIADTALSTSTREVLGRVASGPQPESTRRGRVASGPQPEPARSGGSQVPVVSREGLVALKLQRGSLYDRADIEAIIKQGGPVDVSGFPLSADQREVLRQIESGA